VIRVVFQRGSDGSLYAFQVRGHAEFDDEGLDIVCAGVSALVQGIVCGLKNHLGSSLEFTRRKGSLTCRLPGDLPEGKRFAAGVLMDTLQAALRELAGSYPGNVEVKEEIRPATKVTKTQSAVGRRHPQLQRRHSHGG